jgi:hypothetical protein
VTRGIVFIAFGQEYDKLAAHTVAKSRQFISVPITVLTNIENRHPKWKDVPDVNFIFLDMPTSENRAVKTQIYKYTPYDETLYVDCDSVFIKAGIERVFDHLKESDVVLQHCSLWLDGKKYYRIYRDAAVKFGISLPLRVYMGGFWAFRKTPETIKFFDLWNEYWKTLGAGRDMPALACAVLKSRIPHDIVFKNDHKFFSYGITDEAIIVHGVRLDDLNKHYGIPIHHQYKEFDRGNAHLWKMVYFDEESDAIENDPWIQKKFERKSRIQEMQKYIDTYLPEIKSGGLSVFDIATGPGEFLELANKTGCKSLGIEATEKMNGESCRTIYQKYGLIKHKEKDLDVVYEDMNNVLKNGHPRINGKTFDIINCQHAINAIASGCFNYRREEGPYKNNGEWILDDRFDAFFNGFFSWCKAHLKDNGILVIAALQSENKAAYCARIKDIARKNTFCVEKEELELNLRFRGPCRYA